MNQAERFTELKLMGCAICRTSPVDIHHLRDRTGMGRKEGWERTIPLCPRHHRGEDGFHTIGRKTWEARFGTQQELLEKTNDFLS